MKAALQEGVPRHGLRKASVLRQPASPMDWLAGADGDLRFYGSARERAAPMEIAGIGVAEEHVWSQPVDYADVFATLEEHLRRADPGLRYYGGFRFSQEAPMDRPWSAFGHCRFIVPRLECINGPKGLLVSMHYRDDERAGKELETWLHRLATLSFEKQDWNDTFPPPGTRTDRPDFSGWERNVLAALDDFASGQLEKVVLARKADYSFEGRLDPVTLLHRLKGATPDCYHFCFMPDPALAFVGASPERLYRREGRHIETEAVAGTRMRGRTPARDTALGAELLSSDKDLREHTIVCDGIREVLEPLCVSIRMDEQPRLLKLARGQHLYTGVEGVLRDEVTDADLLRALHPTAALGGRPTSRALQRIREWEPFDRGWYAAPVGWVSRDAAEFAVAIRSALVRPDGLSLFSGAGIVAGSTPEDEWDEIELKIRDFIKVLTGP